jgi:cystathionine beta-lyase family protein involved in aluminum resistance
MNELIYRICENIINKKIKNISLHDVIFKNEKSINDYINHYNKYTVLNKNKIDIYSFEFKIQLFKKLVLYNYCFNYNIENNTNEEDIVLINQYISSINDNILNLKVLDYRFKSFLDWCKKYNRINKKKIQFNISKHAITFR